MTSRNFRSHGGGFRVDHWPSFDGKFLRSIGGNCDRSSGYRGYGNQNYTICNGYSTRPTDYIDNYDYGWADNNNYVKRNGHPSAKRRKFSGSAWGETKTQYVPDVVYDSDLPSYSNPVAAPPSRSSNDVSTSTSCKRNRSVLEDEEPVFMSRDEIERISPSRKDGIDALRERHLRYSYCAFIQNLGMRLHLPQTTIGTAMVLCHRFFVRRSHACHDRFLIATAALFLASKSEETPCPLNSVLQASSEILHKQTFAHLSYLLPIDWFEQYRERLLGDEQIILTTLNFELDVEHPYVPLTSILNKLGLSHTVLVNIALNLVSEGLRSSLWLQFKPHHIAAGAAYLAAKYLNMDLADIPKEFQTTPYILQDVTQQLMELF